MKKYSKNISAIVLIMAGGICGVFINNIPKEIMIPLSSIISVVGLFILSNYIRRTIVVNGKSLGSRLQRQKNIVAILYLSSILYAAFIAYTAFFERDTGLTLNDINIIFGQLIFAIGPAEFLFYIAHKNRNIIKLVTEGKDLPKEIKERYPKLIESGYFHSKMPNKVMIISYLFFLLWFVLIFFLSFSTGGSFLRI